MKRRLTILAVLCLLIATLAVSVNANAVSENVFEDRAAVILDAAPLNGLVQVKGVWGYYKNNVLQTEYTGLVKHTNGIWYYVHNGTVNWNYTGVTTYNGATYYVQKGRLIWGVNGLVSAGGNWYYLKNSVVQTGYTGLVKHTNGTWYYVDKGAINWGYIGVTTYNGATYYVQKGRLVWGVNGLVSAGGNWYYLKNSAVQTGYTGLVKHTNGRWYYVQKGQISFGYTGLVKHTTGTWYYVQKGSINWDYTGLAQHSNGTWYYIQKGILVWGYNGVVEHTNGKLYYITNSTIDWTYDVVSTFQDGHGWKAVTLGSYTATIEDDTEDYLIGSQSVRFTNCIQADNLGLDMAGKHIRVRFKINSIDPGANLSLYVADTANFGAFMAFDIFNTAQKETHRAVKVGEWADMIIPWCSSESTNIPDISTVGTLRFKFVNGAGDANIQFVALQDIPPVERKGVVTFAFDDGLVTQYTEAAEILSARGIPATAYIIPSLVGVSDSCMTEEQIVSLKNDYGWDIECHGANRLDNMTDDEIIADFTFTKQWIQERGLGSGEHYAYPNGVFDARIKNLVQKYFTTARTIDYSTLNGYGSSLLPDPYNIRAVSAIANNRGGHSVAKVKSEIDRVAQYGGWLILVFHSIGDEKTNMYCSAEDLAGLADYAISKGVDIKTVADMLE